MNKQNDKIYYQTRAGIIDLMHKMCKKDSDFLYFKKSVYEFIKEVD